MLAESAAQPLVLVLEDLHWGDLPSVKFIDSALRAASERPFMVLALARPEVHETFPNLWEQRSLQEIRLGPLVRRAGERSCARSSAPTSTPRQCARLLERAAGNAFYLEELIRAFAEGSGLHRHVPARRSHRLRAAGRAGCRARRVVAPGYGARDGRGTPRVVSTRWLVACSAPRACSARSSGGAGSSRSPAATTRRARSTTGSPSSRVREIVQRRDDSRFPAEHEYQFRHALVRDAAYQMLTAEDRALGHKLAGEWLGDAGEHEAMVLAEHFERGVALDKAAIFYGRAAAQALEGNDFTAARMRAERAHPLRRAR